MYYVSFSTCSQYEHMSSWWLASLFFTAEEEERVTGKNLKQAESLACTKTRTRELNTGFIADRYHATVLLYLQ